MPPVFTLESAGISDIGKKRAINEDNFFLSKEDGLFLVADGMGGHEAGDLASRIAVDTVVEFIRNTSENQEITWPYQRDDTLSYNMNRLAVAIKLANKKIYTTSRRRNLEGMGTTVAATFYDPAISNTLYIGHVGDSRIYRFRNSHLERLTRDHSLLNDSLERGDITESDVDNFPYKNIITRALGVDENVEVDILEAEISTNDTFLICSDGLSNEISDADMADILAAESDLAKSTQTMINRANDRGGHDNMSVIVVRFRETDLSPSP